MGSHHDDDDPRSGRFIPTFLQLFRRPGDVLATSESRHAWIDTLARTRVARLLEWVPMILLMAMACSEPIAAVWSAFAVHLVVMIFKFYRSRYDEFLNFPDWLSMATLLALVLIIILLYEANLSHSAFSPILTTFMFVAVAVSLFFPGNFAAQRTDRKVDATVRASPGFRKLTMQITGIWVGIFGIICVCSWVSFGLYGKDEVNVNGKCKSNTGAILLNTVVPIVLPVIGILIMPLILPLLKKANGLNEDGKKDDGKAGADDDEERASLLQT